MQTVLTRVLVVYLDATQLQIALHDDCRTKNSNATSLTIIHADAV